VWMGIMYLFVVLFFVFLTIMVASRNPDWGIGVLLCLFAISNPLSSTITGMLKESCDASRKLIDSLIAPRIICKVEDGLPVPKGKGCEIHCTHDNVAFMSNGGVMRVNYEDIEAVNTVKYSDTDVELRIDCIKDEKPLKLVFMVRKDTDNAMQLARIIEERKEWEDDE
ncbi:MAG: hypothetical protein IJR45_00505, partial [Firmicutes bacterium]|nr:hypothetical protein [Bacillota bacterium]